MQARFILVAILITLLRASLASAAAKPAGVSTELLADISAIQPGTPFTLAMVITPPPEWHIYWKNPGDAGAATKLTFHLPAGFQADDPQFPLPTKFAQVGDIVAYGYTGSTVLLVRITPPKELPAGEKIQLSVDASWLCCKDVCVPGSAKLSITLPSADAKAGTTPEPHKELFEKARAVIPDSAAPAEVVAAITPDEGPTAKATQATPGLKIQWKKEVQGVEIFPFALDGLEVSDMKIENQKDQTHVSLHVRVLAGSTLQADRLPLLVAYRNASGERRGFYTDVDLRALAAGVTQ